MTSYAITISPPYKAYNSPSFLYNGDKPLITKYLNRFSNHYCIYPELDNNNRLHYHGIIDIKDMIKFRHIKYEMDRILGFIKIDKFIEKNNKTKFQHKLTFLIYSMKQWPLNKDYFIKPIIYKKLQRRRRQKESKDIIQPKDIITMLDINNLDYIKYNSSSKNENKFIIEFI